MKNKISYIIILLSTIFFIGSGCGTMQGIFSGNNKNKQTRAEEKSRQEILNTDQLLSSNTDKKLDEISQLSYGTGYALSKINNPPKEVRVAENINNRVISLSGNPTIDKIKEMKQLIDNLTSKLKYQEQIGKENLDKKDKEIISIQNETKELINQKNEEIRSYMQQAAQVAVMSDAYKTELQSYSGWFGLKAVFKGLWQFTKTSLWFLIGFIFLFFILRLLSMSNPLAASIFSIFSTMASWIVRSIEVMVPKAVSIAGHTANNIFNVYKSTLTKVVDEIQMAKEKAKETGKPFDLSSLLDNLEHNMNEKEKEIIKDIKVALNWKQNK